MWIISIGIGKTINGKSFVIVSVEDNKNTYSYAAVFRLVAVKRVSSWP